MSTISLALMMLVGAAGPGDAHHLRDRNITIPIRINAARQTEIRELILYVSIDQGRLWTRAGVATPDMQSFSYVAPTDGLYWFNVAVAFRDGRTEPADINLAPPQLKVMIDTQKPQLRFVTAERVGDEAFVVWEIQEPNPDFGSFQLEYRPTDPNAGAFATAAQATAGLTGQARFKLNTAGAVNVQLQIKDTAGNVGMIQKELPGGGVASTSNMPVPVPPITQTMASNPAVNAPPTPTFPEAPAPVAPAPVMTGNDPNRPAPLASSRNDALQSRSNSGMPTAPPVGSGLAPIRNGMPEAFFTNDQQIVIDYELEKVGPSGISKLEVYLTQDEGRTWMKWNDVPKPDPTKLDPLTPNRIPVSIKLPKEELVYGIRIVPVSGVMQSTGAPQSSELPEMRVQLDRTKPEVTLFMPEPDPTSQNALVLQWEAKDLNLAQNPIRLQYAETLNGEWHDITPTVAGFGGKDGSAGVPNTGRYTWQLPATNPPLKVYLRIVAVDQAGNIGEAVSRDPILVDTYKPKGRINGMIDPKRRQ